MRVKISTLFINIIAIFIGFISECNILFFIAFLIWLNLFLYSIHDISNRSMLFAFMIAFFTFLLGRDLCEEFFHYKVENIPIGALNHTYLAIIISLSAIVVGYLFYEKYSRRSNYKNIGIVTEEDRPVKEVSRIVFYITWIFAIISKIVVAGYVSANSYADFYTDYSDYLTGNTVLYLISKIETMMPTALCIFAASMPSKKEFKLPCIFYLMYLIVSLGSGQRSIFILGFLFLIVYFLFRNSTNPEDEWVKRSYYIIAVISVPILAVFFSLYSYWRFSMDSSSVSLVDAFVSFIYDQGVSSNVLKKAYLFHDILPKQMYTLEFLHSGLFARLLGIPVYHGNTVAHAMFGGSLTHSLGYQVLGKMYLAGRGTGSSYIAELFYDFGYIGVFLGSLMYSYFLARINKRELSGKTFAMAVRFCFVQQLLWAPRASFTGFITNLFAPFTLICFLFIFGMASLIRSAGRLKIT